MLRVVGCKAQLKYLPLGKETQRKRETERERTVCIGGVWGVHWECIQVTDVIPSVTCHILPSV